MTALDTLVQQSTDASRVLSRATTAQKNDALKAMARSLRDSAGALCAENAKDLEAARQQENSPAFLDRLALDAQRIEAMAKAVESVAALEDPVGQQTEAWSRPNGLKIRKVRLPLGVVLVIYESRPNVTSDAAALCLKSGNAVVLRGGSESLRSNQAIAAALSRGLADARLPAGCVALVPTADRQALVELLGMEGRIDLCIPRGGEGLIRFVAEHARIPVVKHDQGICHVYVHESADPELAERITVNAKASRPGVCNAAECLLIDHAVAKSMLPRIARALHRAGVELRGCPETVGILERSGIPVRRAQPDDYGREFLALIIAIRVVKDFDAALDHIERFGSEHTEAIVARSAPAIARFTREVCASAVVVNASTRFNDGGELGLGAEIGISTSRLHAFGPMGLKELTAQKYVVEGSGQVR